MRIFNYPKNKDSAIYFQNVTHKITELIKTIDFLVNFPNPSTNKIRISFDDDDDFSQYIRGIYSPTFGQCFSMEVPIWIKQLKVKLSKYNKSFSIQKKYLKTIFSRSRLLNLLLKWTLIYMSIIKDSFGILTVSLRPLSKQNKWISWKYFMTYISLYPWD